MNSSSNILRLNGISLEGIASSAPKGESFDSLSFGDSIDVKKFMASTGVGTSRRVTKNLKTSDLAITAFNNLVQQLDLCTDQIDILVVVTQTSDYLIPNLASVLHKEFNLRKDTIVFDINLGCSGYVYGLSVISGLLQSLNLKRGVLITTDTLSKTVGEHNHGLQMLFGDAASATLLHKTGDENQEMVFCLNSDGRGYEAIIDKSSGYHSSNSSPSLELNGVDVFNFALKEVPVSITSVLSGSGESKDEIDWFFLHQANKLINNSIAKKLGLPLEKFPTSLAEFGNTSSSSIPVTMCLACAGTSLEKYVMSGFGVGLSWGTLLARGMSTKVFSVVEI